MTTTLTPLQIGPVEGVPRLEWAAHSRFYVPSQLAARVAGGKAAPFTITSKASGLGHLAEETRLVAAFTPRRPASSRLPFSYQAVPLPIRTAIGHIIGRVQRARAKAWAEFPRWPLDLSADFVSDLCGGPPSPFAGAPVPVLLSHDIDTSEGLHNAVDQFLSLEESVGARSSNYIVPCAWPIDHGLLHDLAQRGHEIGIHGYDHSNRTPFAEESERRQRLDAARPLIERYGIIGYRAPSLLRTSALLDDVARLYTYDSSIPTSGGLFPVPNNGCASARPFLLGSLTEIPLTLPRDGSLAFLGHTPREILGIWIDCAQRIAASGGIVSLLTHCESRFSGNPAMLSVYKQFLEYLASDGRYRFAKPADLLKHAGG